MPIPSAEARSCSHSTVISVLIHSRHRSSGCPWTENLWYWSIYTALPSLHQMPTLSAEARYDECSAIVSAQAHMIQNSQLPYAPYAETRPQPSSMLPLPACANAHPVNRGAFLQQQSMLLTTLYKQCSCRPTHTQPLIPVQICLIPLYCPHQPASMPVLSTKSLSCNVSINT